MTQLDSFEDPALPGLADRLAGNRPPSWSPSPADPTVWPCCAVYLALQPDRERIVAAHFNHRLRGAAADADQQFVQQTCQSLNVHCLLGDADPVAYPQARAGTGLESAARQLRYRFLIETAEQSGARYVATGHTADDQAETVLHHVLRGTGLAGLAGIPAIRRASEAVTLVRPLLSFSRRNPAIPGAS